MDFWKADERQYNREVHVGVCPQAILLSQNLLDAHVLFLLVTHALLVALLR